MKQHNMYIIVLIILVAIGGYFLYKKVTPDNMLSSKGEPVLEDNTKNTMNDNEVTALDIQVTQEGTGVESKKGDVLSMNYTGKLLNGTTFDSNVDPKFNHVTPFEFTLGAGMVIRGWDEGLVGMKVGEKRILTIPSDMGYGARGAGASIPPNAALVFEVELLKIK